uniref:Uncharacterized protein n=1 Tax=Chromera velia CCMP2878 TaxID=1169474 RepID=A0A0G4GQM5_9ALVE|mmetsp:Transcript_29043/g.56889  ORF Transcript_29043/g.56889 Transcript_29043/m.56889 type:complete len:367 (+) Transcript_29043:211-1311(+)|eukprot:Cvel_5048.t1-p1 / transcript=Cvel_5048.t1 / gene=Cvel_5048 / organism=Chromera_velia_CCMP2878 / gene_product=50S ribosomal protein L2, putative / transcript_product=50S ribosomal protein L2, putative / location=Cvel_scaffold230:25688-31037(-) / protein_length=366 / sequence_SO=supercontig / SO=protein_coding / is_pseudo=false
MLRAPHSFRSFSHSKGGALSDGRLGQVVLSTPPCNLFQRRASGAYNPLIKRNKSPYMDFETLFPKKPIPAPTVVSAFTMAKQVKIEKLLTGASQRTWQGRVIRQLSIMKVQHAGRNDTGQITTKHLSGGTIKRLRFIDFKRARKDIFATVLRIEHDPSRSAHIALIQYEDGVLSYILAPITMRAGDKVIASERANITPGNCLPLKSIPVGSVIHNIEMRPGAGGQMIRAAGTHATILSKDADFATIKLKSTEIRKFPLACWATIGQLSNTMRAKRSLAKAGRNIWRGRRPHVRGNAMNPSDHPHGGGTHAKNSKRPPVSMWGIHRQGYKTRSKHKPRDMIVRRHLCKREAIKYGQERPNINVRTGR